MAEPKTKKDSMRIAVFLTRRTVERLNELQEETQMSRSAVVSQAIAKWYRDERRKGKYLPNGG
jgi:hypothetical protein